MLRIDRVLAMAWSIALIPTLSHCGDDGGTPGDDDDDMVEPDGGTSGTDAGDPMPVLVGIAVAPDAFELAPDATRALSVTGTYDDASSGPITEGLGWQSSDDAIATVDAAGTVTGVAAGVATVTATVDGLTGQAAVTVVPAGDPSVVFADGYGPGVAFEGFAGSINDVTITTDEAQSGTSSLRMPVPGAGFAGGTFLLTEPRDMSAFDAVSFWIKADAPHTIDVVGIGDWLDANRYKTERRELAVNTEWRQYLVPVPDPSRFDGARGLFHIAEGTEGAYTIFLDEIRYVTAEPGTITNPRPSFATGTTSRSQGARFTVDGPRVVYAIDGVDVAMTPTGAGFFELVSSDPAVVAVRDDGVLEALSAGTVAITGFVNGVAASGELTATVLPFLGPVDPAPTPPSRDDAEVISLFSGAYTDVTVDTFRTSWSDARTTLSTESVGGDDTLRYTDLVFVGIETLAETIDTTDMTHFHFDVWIEDPTTPVAFTTKLVDVGPDDDLGGAADNSDAEMIYFTASLTPRAWQSYDIPLSDFEDAASVGALAGRAHIGQLLFTGNREPAPTPVTVWIDNIYFYAE